MKITLHQPYSFCQVGARDYQEDCRFPDADEPKQYAPFFVVCDGVGGSEKGEVASRTVCEAFATALADTDWDKPFLNSDFKTALDFVYKSMHKAANSTNRDMATTLTFAAFHAEGCTVAHIGDSRIYHVRPHKGILYRSDDHSLVNALVHSGNLTPEEAINHPNSNVITRCICVPEDGQELASATVMLIEDIVAGDYIFLCSDGVLHKLTEEALVDILSSDLSDKEKMNRIAQMCIHSDDNNTAYLIPISQVQKDEIPYEEVEDANDVGTSTTVFSRKPQQAREVASEAKSTLYDNIRHFFKNLF